VGDNIEPPQAILDLRGALHRFITIILQKITTTSQTPIIIAEITWEAYIFLSRFRDEKLTYPKAGRSKLIGESRRWL
jgi:hypothetical protein